MKMNMLKTKVKAKRELLQLTIVVQVPPAMNSKTGDFRDKFFLALRRVHASADQWRRMMMRLGNDHRAVNCQQLSSC